MEFLDPAKKKKHNQRLMIGYLLVGIAILLSTLILFYQSSGYDVDRKTGKVVQNGLIFVSSQPESSTFYLNGKQKDQTDSRVTVPAGTYTVELKRNGYRSWKRTINLEGSSIERLQYPRLFPEKLNTKDLATYDKQPGFSLQSLDRKWVLVSKPGTITSFDIFDTGDIKKPAAALSLPADLFTAPEEQKLTLVEWSDDNRHVLIRHDYKDRFEYVIVDRENPALSANLSRAFNLDNVAISLRDKRFDQLYVLDKSTNQLRTLDTKTKQFGVPLGDVLSYKSYGDNTLLYIQKDKTNAQKAMAIIRDNSKDYKLTSLPTDSEYLLDFTRYDDHWFVAVGAASLGRVSIFRDPLVKQKTATSLPLAYSVLLMKDAKYASFSANARFILLQSSNHFAVYDAETNRRYYYDMQLAIPEGQKVTWMDGHRLLAHRDGKLVVFDFNGINEQTLVKLYDGTTAFFDRDYQRVFTLAPSQKDAAKAAISETPLKLNLQ